MKKIRLLIIGILVVFLASTCYVPKVYAWGPVTHICLTKNCLESAGDTVWTTTIRNNENAFWFGVMFPDVTVIYYYTNFTSYQSTHSWAFYHELLQHAQTEEDRAFCYGIAIHLIQDCFAHNYYVPMKIRQTKFQNGVIHPIVEGVVETHTISDNVDAVAKSMGAMARATDEDEQRFNHLVSFANEALDKDFSYEAETFADILGAGAFYSHDRGFTIPGGDAIWELYKGVSKYLSQIVNVEDADVYLYEQAYQATLDFFNKGVTPTLDPSGTAELLNANSQVYTETMLIISLIIGVLLVIIYIRRRRAKGKGM